MLFRSINSPNYEIFGFDSFEGLPEDWLDSSGNIVAVHSRKGAFSVNGIVPNIPGIKFFKGWFDVTIHEYLLQAKPIALLHIDCDLYSSCKTVLYNLNDYIVPGTILVFDEWVYNFDIKFNDHEQKCFYEWAADHKREFELVDFDGDSIERQIVRVIK